MAKLVSLSEMLAIEKAADAAGHSYAKMMEQAGQSIANIVIAHSHYEKLNISAIIGKGNNGGDALIALAKLSSLGYKTIAFLANSREADPLLDELSSAGGEIVVLADIKAEKFSSQLLKSDIFLDAFLGTGIVLPLRETAAKVLNQISNVLALSKESPLRIAIDCPSGMDVQSGELAPETMRADITICLAAVKVGMLTFPAFNYLGELFVGDIGLDDEIQQWKSVKRQIVDQNLIADTILDRASQSHKGTFGKTLIIAGSDEYPGAALLAAKAAGRSGVGLVSIAYQDDLQKMIAAQVPEATWVHLQNKKPFQETYNSLLIGPGLNESAWVTLQIEELLKSKALPKMVLDAYALRYLANKKEGPRAIKQLSILTPHPGEMAALTGLSSADIQKDRLQIAEEYAAKWGHIVVLKGALSIVAHPQGPSALIPIANPALATAGSGDVLAGIIAGLWAQGLEAFEAAFLGVWCHAQAAIHAAEHFSSDRGIIASDLLPYLPKILAK